MGRAWAAFALLACTVVWWSALTGPAHAQEDDPPPTTSTSEAPATTTTTVVETTTSTTEAPATTTTTIPAPHDEGVPLDRQAETMLAMLGAFTAGVLSGRALLGG